MTAPTRPSARLAETRCHDTLAASRPVKKRTKAWWLPAGLHVAPFRSLNGHPVLLSVGDRGILWSIGEIAEVVGATDCYMWPDTKPINDRWPMVQFVSEMFARGVHRAPWRMNIARGTRALCTAFLAIDKDHRMLSMLVVQPNSENEPPSEEAEAEAARTLQALLEAHEETEAEATEATSVGPIPCYALHVSSQFFKPTRRGIWSRGGREYLFVDHDCKHIATLTLHGDLPGRLGAFQVSDTMRYLLADLDPSDDDYDDEDDDPAENWKK